MLTPTPIIVPFLAWKPALCHKDTERAKKYSFKSRRSNIMILIRIRAQYLEGWECSTLILIQIRAQYLEGWEWSTLAGGGEIFPVSWRWGRWRGEGETDWRSAGVSSRWGRTGRAGRHTAGSTPSPGELSLLTTTIDISSQVSRLLETE